MSASQVRVLIGPEGGRAYWLPFFGTGNGLTASAWAPIAELPKVLALECLRACGEVDVAAFVAPSCGPRPRRRLPPYRVWVDSRRFSSAEDAIRQMLSVVDAEVEDSDRRSLMPWEQ